MRYTCGSISSLSTADIVSLMWQALVELYEYLLKCSCDMTQEASPERKSCLLSKRLPLLHSCMSESPQFAPAATGSSACICMPRRSGDRKPILQTPEQMYDSKAVQCRNPPHRYSQ